MCVIVLGLVPYSSYRFTLGACTVADCTNSSTIVVETFESLPTGETLYFSVCSKIPSFSVRVAACLLSGVEAPRTVVKSTTELVVNWFPPANINGMVKSYQLFLRAEESSVWTLTYSGLERSIEIGQLQPGITYLIRLQVRQISIACDLERMSD